MLYFYTGVFGRVNYEFLNLSTQDIPRRIPYLLELLKLYGNLIFESTADYVFLTRWLI
jgi:hypothetical protein